MRTVQQHVCYKFPKCHGNRNGNENGQGQSVAAGAGVGQRFPVILTARQCESGLALSLSVSLSGQQVHSVHRTKEVACAGRTRLSYLALIYYSIFNVFTNTSQAQGQAPGQDSACSGLPDYLLESTSGTVKRVAHSRRSVSLGSSIQGDCTWQSIHFRVS